MRKHCWRMLCALLVTAALVGCKVGPECCPTYGPLLPEWRQALDESLEASGAADQVWWTTFNDPCLNGLVERARMQNLSLLEAEARIREARAMRGVVRGGLFPDVGLTGAYTRGLLSSNGFPIGSGLGGSSSPSPFAFDFKPYNLFQGGFDMSWEIDVFGRVRRSLEAAGADIHAALEGRNALEVSLVGEVAANYVTLRTLEQRIITAQKNADIQDKTRVFVQNQFDAGKVTDIELGQAKSILYRTRSAVPLLQRELERATNRLCVLQGEQPQDLSAALAGPKKIPTPPKKIAVGIPVNLIRQRPDVRRAEWEVIAQSSRIGVATADLYPQFKLTGTFTVDSTDITKWFSPDSLSYNFLPAMRWDILNFGRLRSAVAVQDARWEQALMRYRQAILLAVEEVEGALSNYVRTREAAEELNKAVAGAKDALRVSQRQFDEGRVSYQSLLESQRMVVELEDRQQEMNGAVALGVVTLYKALGGGWDWRTGPSPEVAVEAPAEAALSDVPDPPPVP